MFAGRAEVALGGGGQQDLHDAFEYLTPLSSGNLKRPHLVHVDEMILANR